MTSSNEILPTVGFGDVFDVIIWVSVITSAGVGVVWVTMSVVLDFISSSIISAVVALADVVTKLMSRLFSSSKSSPLASVKVLGRLIICAVF